MKNNEERRRSAEQKEAWQPMKIAYVGDVNELVLNGTAKITVLTGDPGEPLKNRHQDS
jgi:hypothetical protein